MRFAKIKFVAVLTVAATVIGLSTTAAFAADYTVDGGNSGGAIVALNSGNLVFTDTVGGASLTCTHLSAPGAAIDGSHSFAPATPPPSGALDSALNVTLTSSSLSGCTNPIVGASIITASGTWSFGVVSKAGSVSTGYLNFVQLHISAATCSFDAKGYLLVSYNNSTANLTTGAGAGLVLSNVTGSACALIHATNGHTAKLTGIFQIGAVFKINW